MSDITTGIKLNGDATGLVGETKRARDELGRFVPAARKAGQQAKRSSRDFDAMTLSGGKLLSSVKLLGAGLITTFSASSIVLGIANTARRFEVLQAALVTATGSAEKADGVFKAIQKTAAITPFSVEELTTAFIKLKNLGLDPSRDSILSYGNTASAMGKSLDQFIEAVADASVAEFERLKEFGIKAKNQGDTIEFTFRGLKTSVANNAAAIESYLQKLGKTEFAGAMVRQAATLDGAISNIGDSWDSLKFSIAQAGVSELMQDTLRSVSGVLDELTNQIASGELLGYISAWGSAWSGWGSAVEQSIGIAMNAVGQFPLHVLAAKAIVEETLNVLGDAFLYWPQNVKAMVQAVVVEIASMGTQGRAYAVFFGQVVLAELERLTKKAGIYAKELADLLNPFDGDTFDFDAEMNGLDNYIDRSIDQYQAAAAAKIKASKNARESVLQDIFDERQASISSTNAQIAAAKALANVKIETAANDNSFNSDPETNYTPAQGEVKILTTVSDSQLESLRKKLASKEELLAIHLQNEQAMLSAAYAQKKLSEDEYNALTLASKKQYFDGLEALQLARNNVILSSAAQTFDGLSGIAKTFSGESAKAYKILFSISKGFAIAQGIMNLSTAISNASALPWPANIPAMATAASTGASIVANIKGVTLQGQAHAGLDRNVREGTWWLRNDEMVLNPNQRRSFENMVAANESGQFSNSSSSVYSPTIHIDATNAVPGMEQRIREEVERGQQEQYARFQEDFANGGPLSQSLSGVAA